MTRKKKTTVYKRSLSLLELMVVLAILALVGSLFGVRGKEMIEHYAFSSAVDKVASRCKLARCLADNYQTDVQVKIVQTPKGMTVALQSDEPPLQKLPQFTQPLNVKGIKQIRFEDENVEEVVVLFSGSGGIFPEGVVYLEGKKKAKEIPFLLSVP